jgi:tRNA (cmo5U34)-methyltransferase
MAGRNLGAHFGDAAAVARYAEGPPRMVPGFDGLHRMMAVLLAEGTGAEADVLVLGAGGGLELRMLAQAQPGWRFTGVDPSAPMLALAREAVGHDISRVMLIEGVIDDAPPGPFDAATCLLTLHFLPAEERLRTLRALHDRLRPGAPFVAAHLSAPREGRAKWIDRYAAFAVAQGLPEAQAAQAGVAVGERLPILDPIEDQAILREAGFGGIELFYAGLAFRGWVARA